MTDKPYDFIDGEESDDDYPEGPAPGGPLMDESMGSNTADEPIKDGFSNISPIDRDPPRTAEDYEKLAEAQPSKDESSTDDFIWGESPEEDFADTPSFMDDIIVATPKAEGSFFEKHLQEDNDHSPCLADIMAPWVYVDDTNHVAHWHRYTPGHEEFVSVYVEYRRLSGRWEVEVLDPSRSGGKSPFTIIHDTREEAVEAVVEIMEEGP